MPKNLGLLLGVTGVLNIAFREGESRIRNGSAPKNFGEIMSLTKAITNGTI